MMAAETTISLSGGVMMPRIGLGTYPMKGKECEKAVEEALDAGYRLIDTAVIYSNHQSIGNVLKAQFDGGKLQRKDIFITTKLPGDFMNSPEAAKRCLELCLKELQLDYVDLFLIHGPCGIQVDDNGKKTFLSCDLAQTWKGMEACVDLGLARSIGVSNFNVSQLQRIVSAARIPVANNQIECHVYLQQRRLRDFCNQHNIVVTAYAPLGIPGKDKGFRKVIEDAKILALARKHGKSPAQVLLNFLLSENIAVVPKSSNRQRMDENLHASFSLDNEDVKILRQMDCGIRYYDMLKIWDGHPDYPFVQDA